VATPAEAGRRLWWWPYKEFVNMIRRAAWTALAVRRAVPANRPPDDRFPPLTTDRASQRVSGDAVASAADAAADSDSSPSIRP